MALLEQVPAVVATVRRPDVRVRVERFGFLAVEEDAFGGSRI
ncbi:hypothetical protein [Nonomuraea lactucae]|nr:hypothetical protein [Nonomuraea lactucae]